MLAAEQYESVWNMILQALNHDPTACLRAFQCEQHVNRCGTAEIHVRNAGGENSEFFNNNLVELLNSISVPLKSGPVKY